MKIVIVGANGQVGKELALIFKAREHEVTALVRNPFGAAFFQLNDIPFVISDITADDKALKVLKEAEIVVIAAVARGQFNEAFRQNKAILNACILKCQKSANVVFFSSIRVFSKQIDKAFNRWEPLQDYDKEKLASERYFKGICETEGITGRIFRLGHVIGSHQAKTVKFKEALEESPVFAVDGNAPSNTVHTMTIADAILNTYKDSRKIITATLVNQPQWSWRAVFRFVDEESNPRFIAQSLESQKRRTGFLRWMLRMLRPIKKWLKQYKHHLKSSLGYKVYLEGRSSEINEELQLLADSAQNLSEFNYRPAPGPFLDEDVRN